MQWLSKLLTSKLTLCTINLTGVLEFPNPKVNLRHADFTNVKVAYDINAEGVIDNVAVLKPVNLMAYEEVALEKIARYHLMDVVQKHIKAVTTLPTSIEVSVKHLNVFNYGDFGEGYVHEFYAEKIKIQQLM
jgi:hypothetical protein